MWHIFDGAAIDYAPGLLNAGDAAARVIPAAAFAAARNEISHWTGYHPTPLHRLRALASELAVRDIYYKDEGPRFGLGSFKALGGAYAVKRLLQNQGAGTDDKHVPMTVTSATDGNHGRSVAWGAKRFGLPCQIFIHAEVSAEREQAMRDLGATVSRVDGDYDAAVAACRRAAAEYGWQIVSDTSWPGYTATPGDVMAGYGVMAAEINQDLTEAPSHVFLQGGVGGLAAAVAAAMRQHWGVESPRLIVVEPALAPCLIASARAGKATAVKIEAETLMAGLSCGEPSLLAWEILAEEAADFLTVPESLVGASVRLLARPRGGDPVIAAGESAIGGLAGFIAAARQPALRDRLGLDRDARILLIGSEGVTDRASFDRLMAEGEIDAFSSQT